MLTRMECHLGQGLPLSCHSASLFQGMLMQRIDPVYGEILHRSELKPYSQYIDCRTGYTAWILQTLTKDTADQLITAPGLSENDTIHLERLNLTVNITAVHQESLSHEELLKQTFFSTCPRTVKLRFVTPTAFKVQGHYQIYPTIQHILGSLIQKYDAVHTKTEIAEDGLLEDFQRFISVIGYNLRSTFFSVEGITIPSFTGTLLLKISGPQQLVNLVHLLLRFGTYSGVGIKTAMGMGALQLVEKRKGDPHARNAVSDGSRRPAP